MKRDMTSSSKAKDALRFLWAADIGRPTSLQSVKAGELLQEIFLQFGYPRERLRLCRILQWGKLADWSRFRENTAWNRRIFRHRANGHRFQPAETARIAHAAILAKVDRLPSRVT